MISPPDAVCCGGGIEIEKANLSVATVLVILSLLYQLYSFWCMIVYDRRHIHTGKIQHINPKGIAWVISQPGLCPS
jgi:hypothetical protein